MEYPKCCQLLLIGKPMSGHFELLTNNLRAEKKCNQGKQSNRKELTDNTHSNLDSEMNNNITIPLKKSPKWI